jgi:hypothetical protein
MTSVFDLFLARVDAEPRQFTYVGVGTNPHAPTVEKLDDAWDQLMPVFVREQLHKTVRVMHFDPAFTYMADRLDFVREYFATKYPLLVYAAPTEEKPYHSWTSTRLEVLLAGEAFNYKSAYSPDEPHHESFLVKLTTMIVGTGGHLVLQDFSGRDPLGAFKSAYEASPKPNLFKRRVLFDITYGNASCSTDLRVHKPIYDRHGDFISFTLFSADEIRKNIGHNPRLDELIKRHFIAKYKAKLNHHHVNYRRRILGDTCLTRSEFYDDNASPQLIMGVLQHELAEFVTIFKELQLVDAAKEACFNALMENYATINMYDWNTHVNRLF